MTENDADVISEPKCKPCCACPETRIPRDECVIENGEENCQDLIEAHKQCMLKHGFVVWLLQFYMRTHDLSLTY